MVKIAVGDVVTLNSGGPGMVVTHVERGEAFVTWLDFGIVYRERFPNVCLSKYPTESPTYFV